MESDNKRKPSQAKRIIILLMLGIFGIILPLLPNSISRYPSGGNSFLSTILAVCTALLAMDWFERILKLLEKRGMLRVGSHKNLVGRWLAAFTGMTTFPLWNRLFSPIELVHNEHTKPIMVFVACMLFALGVVSVALEKWYHSKWGAEALEERELIQHLKAQGCTSAEIFERIKALIEERDAKRTS